MRSILACIGRRCAATVAAVSVALPLAVRADEGSPVPPSFDATAAYTGEIWSQLDGGQRSDQRYLDNVDLQLTIDLAQAAGWPGAKLFVYGLYNNGTSFSGDLVGDLQGVSNIETGIQALRLEEAWLDQSFADGHGSVRVGLYNSNSEFDASLVRAVFVNPSHGIGPDFGQAGLNGPSIFPVTSLATRLAWTFDGGAYARLAVLDGVPGDPNHPKRTTIDLSGRDGALIAGEVGLASENGRVLSLGLWDFTAAFDDLTQTTPLGDPLRRHDNRGAYAAAEGPLWSKEDHDALDVSGFVRVGVASDDVNPIGSYFGAGLVATGPLDDRPADKLGLAVAIANVGDRYRKLIEDAGGRPRARELNVELTYQAPVVDGLVIQPDLQWIDHPNADASVRNALVIGIRFKFDRNWSD